ncbi:Tc5 transposase DNA-binding domain [Popillia japonica]|uniref:Tc5 transposase DNA-binding domain n=1 Tax=Popillia japonica TaxID=7064 RepID=A0AAW1KFX2_POPJA
MIRERARAAAQSLNVQDFKASSGWFEKFRKRHSNAFKSISGEAADAYPVDVENFLDTLPAIVAGYTADCIYNPYAIALFY